MCFVNLILNNSTFCIKSSLFKLKLVLLIKIVSISKNLKIDRILMYEIISVLMEISETEV